MSGRGAAPAPLADPVALLAPGDDVFFFADRAGRVLAAREPLTADKSAAHDDDDAPLVFCGASPFESTPVRGAFRRYRTVTRACAGDVDGDGPALAVRGSLDGNAERDAWRAIVERALRVIDAGAASKIVLARRVRLRADAVLDARDLVRSMTHADGAYRYLLRQGDVILAGATPERLIEKQGDVIRTEAVAGTAPAEHEDAPLFEREKDRREHLAVVLAIEAALAPITLALDHAHEPVVRRHGPIAHLVTPFEGRIDPAAHVLDVAAALHPTPAVAGTPREVALRFIADNEGMRRGWYGGPIGWFDGNGDGELAVALRCVRIEGRTVDLYAGAGIVAGSDPDTEFDETTLKMRSTLASLGFEPVA